MITTAQWAQRQPPRLTDTTLRDGSHAMRHQYTRKQVQQIAQALDAAGVPVIEVSHGDGLGGSSIQYGFSREPELEWIEAAASVVQQARIAALLLPGIGTRRELKEAVARGVSVLRIATMCTEADISEQHFGMAKEMGLEAVGFLMMAHMRPPEVLLEQALLMQRYGADCVYVVDSAGALLPHEVYARVKTLKDGLEIQVGFHAHNNLGLAIGNTLAALAAGADQIDGTLRGFGAGAGNAATEVLVAVLEKAGLSTGIDLFKIMEAAEFVLGPIMPRQPVIDRDALVIGYAGVYSTFLLHAKRIGQQLGIDPAKVLLELGRRQAVAGQEDWIWRVAAELAAEEEAL